MSMELRPLDPSVEGRARDLYLEAFPEEERFPFDVLTGLTADPDCRFMWMDVDGSFKGIAYVILTDDLLFLLYLAVTPGDRDCGLGSDALWLVKRMAGGRRVFLNAEAVDEQADNIGQRLRRTRFYDRNGFAPQCTYRTPDGQRYLLFSWGGSVTPEEAFALYGSKLDSAGVTGVE